MSSIQIFSLSDFIESLDIDKTQIPIRDDIKNTCLMESQRSDLLYSMLSLIVERTLAEGYAVEYTNAGVTQKVTDVFENLVLRQFWDPELEKALYQGHQLGYYVMRYVETGTKLNGEKVFAPFVLHPEDAVVKFTIDRDGKRKYMAYENKGRHSKPIEQSRVMFFTEPEPDGTPNSPIQKCLELLVSLRELQDSHMAVVHKTAFPMHEFYIDNKEQKLIPNNINSEQVESFGNNFDENLTVDQFGHLNAMSISTQALNNMLYSSRNYDYADEQAEAFGIKQQYDPLNRTFVSAARSNPTLPATVLPQGVRAESNTVRPLFNARYHEDVKEITNRIAGTMGVPLNSIYDTASRYAADYQQAQARINTTVKYWQKQLEKHIVIMFSDLYYKMFDKIFIGISQEMVASAKDRLKNGESKKFDAKILDGSALTELREGMTVSVRFKNNPMLQLEDAKKLYDENIISRETYRNLALHNFGISSAYAKTLEDEEEEMKEDAEKQKLREKYCLMEEEVRPDGDANKGENDNSTEAEKTEKASTESDKDSKKQASAKKPSKKGEKKKDRRDRREKSPKRK